MIIRSVIVSVSIVSLLGTVAFAQNQKTAHTAPIKPKTMADVLAASKPDDWRLLDPEKTLYMKLPQGTVIIAVAADFAPNHLNNIKALIAERFFDGNAIVRVQDNFVTQWGDPGANEEPARPKPLKAAKEALKGEFTRTTKGLPFVALPDKDVYAPQVGFVDGFPVGRDLGQGKAWLLHCYGMVGVGRNNDADSGNGGELYAVIGHAPRQLDRNITVVGRVVQGMELLSSLPRGTGPLGFYEKPEQNTPILSARLGSELPAQERKTLEALRTDTQTFKDLIESRRNRKDDFYKVPAGAIDVCAVPLPVRERKF